MAAREQIVGGQLLARTLKAAGVSRAFALHGGHLEALLKGCIEEGIALTDFRHESAAGHAADGYARVTGQLGVCIVTSGPGFTNAISAMANAQLDGSPVLFIVGAPPLREIETNSLQGGIDQVAMARPAVKWAFSIPSTERIADLTAMAIRKAMTLPRGAVLLEVPIDILHMAVPADRATPPAGVNVRPRPAPAPDEAAALADMLLAAKRPVLIAGTEAANAATADAIRHLVETLPIPVFTKSLAAGLLPAGHPCDSGGAGNLAILPQMGLPSPDLVILLGAKLGLLLGGRSGAVVPDAATLVQIHGDATEIGRIRDVDLAINADCGEAVKALARALAGRAPDGLREWCAQATAAVPVFASLFPEGETAGGIHPFHAAKAVAEAAGPDALYVFDGGESASWGGAATPVNRPASVLSHGYLGCLGIGPGFAIGGQLAEPARRVVHLTGDGALGFHIQELDTMVRHGLPIVNVVLNNQVWGMSIHGQQIMFGGNYHVITKLEGTQYADIAGAFGCHSERVTRLADLAPALERAFASGKTAFIEVMTDADIVHPVTESMLGQVEEGSNDVLIPYYENIRVD
ncbi:MAG: thiamine pyrophosphate-binding protein [Sphingomonadales bacterium]|jgi:acetolactate synthase-1/2/3 large subunit|nr:thiamine pyrophosphate-binding protein [Sphingomonadales bacterium]MBK9002804.1 thiamine pyrophosphate-binding protein [Sphingomonadales bacterium]MBK9268029.1 thiamine pyrophosphate-binding protein [Sphingomonadales bacterium]MBP6433319.1 thiamine pyrophosphate-binding protein [Sphingorhabdus sp.]